jgi:hypothetical protein
VNGQIELREDCTLPRNGPRRRYQSVSIVATPQVPGTLKLLDHNSLIEAVLGLLIVSALGAMPPALHPHMEHMH